jgi:hypothetical protein
MSYGNKSIKYLLPSAVQGDFLSATEEKRKVDIIDSNLEGVANLITDGSGCGVIEEGIYTSTFVSGNSTVYLSENKPTAAIEAFIDDIRVQSFDQLSWTGLLNNATYYLFISLIENGSTESSRQYRSVFETSSTSSTIPIGSLLVATVITTGTTITVNSNPLGKLYIVPFQTHVTDSVDPHGIILTQTNLNAANIVVDTLIVKNYLGTSGISVFGDSTSDTARFKGIIYGEYGVDMAGVSIFRDGLSVGNQKITSLLAPIVGTDAANKTYVDSVGAAASGIDVKKNGSIITSKATKINFSGIGVVVTNSGSGEVKVDIAGGINGIDIEQNTSLIANDATVIRFSGIGVNVSDLGEGRALVDIPAFTGVDTSFYFGSEGVDGSWRFQIDGSGFQLSKRISGNWVEQGRWDP